MKSRRDARGDGKRRRDAAEKGPEKYNLFRIIGRERERERLRKKNERSLLNGVRIIVRVQYRRAARIEKNLVVRSVAFFPYILHKREFLRLTALPRRSLTELEPSDRNEEAAVGNRRTFILSKL